MSIRVTCPGCHKRFQVSDKFAGRTGPCPNCKTKIRVPTKEEEVKIHAPTDFARGGRSAETGELLTKPIERKESAISPPLIGIICGAAVVVLVVTWILGRGGALENNSLISALGLLLISPPLVVAGYSFLKNDEDLEPFSGAALYVRAAICSLVYVLLWGVFAYLAGRDIVTGELWNWVFVAPPFFVVGALAAFACLDLDFGSGFFHYCFYLFVTVLLRWLAGLGWVWQIAEQPLS